MKEYCIIDDFLPDDIYNLIMNTIANPQLYWQFRTHSCDRQTNGRINHDYFDLGVITYSILQTAKGWETEDKLVWPKTFSHLKTIVEKEFPVTVIDAFRCQVNLTFPHTETNNLTMAPHPDGRNPNRDLLNLHKNVEDQRQISVNIFLNDVKGGDFVLFNEAHTPWQGGKITLTEKVRVKSKANRAVVFDSSLYHAGSLSSDVHRLICNTILNVKDKE